MVDQRYLIATFIHFILWHASSASCGPYSLHLSSFLSCTLSPPISPPIWLSRAFLKIQIELVTLQEHYLALHLKKGHGFINYHAVVEKTKIKVILFFYAYLQLIQAKRPKTKQNKQPQTKTKNLQLISVLVAEGHKYWACNFLISVVTFWVTHFTEYKVNIEIARIRVINVLILVTKNLYVVRNHQNRKKDVIGIWWIFFYHSANGLRWPNKNQK